MDINFKTILKVQVRHGETLSYSNGDGKENRDKRNIKPELIKFSDQRE